MGDLVDRGAGSARAAGFLDQPYVIAVPGNHERMLVDLYLDQDSPCEILEAMALVNYNGTDWLARTSAEERMSLIVRFARLPFALEVQTHRGSVGILHGEVPRGMTWPQFIHGLDLNDPAVVKSCLWGRERLETVDSSGVLGIDRIYAGHTPQFGGARRLGNYYAIDTGAVFAEINADKDAMLTFADLVCSTQSLATPKEVGRVHLFTEVSEAPFGQYARGLPKP